MGKWRELFESNLPPVAEREYGEEYQFGPPATAEQLASVERALGVALPAEVRELLSEFNGVWCTTTMDRERGYDAEITYLDTKHMTEDLPAHFADCGGDPLPPAEDLRKVVFVAQSNGFSDLWGVCAEDVAGQRAGTVVLLDHEVAELEASHPSLAEFVRDGPK